MALLKVQLANNQHSFSGTAEEEAAERLASGDVVEVLSDRSDVGFREYKKAWIATGRAAEDFPMNFVLVEVVDMTDEEAGELIKSYPDPADPDCPMDAEGYPIIEYQRRWGFVASGIAPDRQAQLLQSGELVTTRALLSAAIIDKVGELSL